LLRHLGLSFQVHVKPVEEGFPADLQREEIALYLASHKAQAYRADLQPEQVLITADTIVWVEGQALNKPASFEEACQMLRLLSGRSHEVITGVCLLTTAGSEAFHDTTTVFFKELTAAEIDFYVRTYQPYDKAGGYGIQEWIGMVAITKIEGSYFNVMGLPVHKLYEELVRMGVVTMSE
jgi:septum formation protein